MKLHPNWSARENYAKSKKKRKKKDKVRDDGSNGKSKDVVLEGVCVKRHAGQGSISIHEFWWKVLVVMGAVRVLVTYYNML